MTEIFGLDHFGLGLGYFGSVFGLRLIMPRVSHMCHCSKIICSGRHSVHFGHPTKAEAEMFASRSYGWAKLNGADKKMKKF
jgi:hypothetical protein